MTDDTTLWSTLQKHIPRKRWIGLSEIFRIVRHRMTLDAEDLERTTSRSSTPRWEFNVRKILRDKCREGAIRGRRHQAL